jgi:site-specific recombinase
VPLIKTKKNATPAKDKATLKAELGEVLAQLAYVEAELKTSTVSHCKERLRQAIERLAAALETSS